MAQTFTRVSQQAARYKWLGSAMEHCSQCRFFLRNNLCARVIGDVAPGAWCRFFSREAVMRGDAGGGAAATHAGSGGPPGVALDLGFMTPGTLDPRIVFTRASIGTYFDVAGVLQTAGVNLYLQSGTLTNAVWAPVGATATTGTVAPDGSTNATFLKEDATNGAHALQQLVTVTTGVPCTYSVHAKVGTRSVLSMNGLGLAGLSLVPQWNLTTGTDITTGSNATFTHGIQSVGNGWYRCWFTFSPTGTAAVNFQLNSGPSAPNYQGDNVSGLYLWGAQAEQGQLSQYAPTTTAANSSPRWDYDPVTHTLRGLLIEEQRQNIVTNSSAMNLWTVIDTTVTPNNTTSPDGTVNASLCTEGIAGGGSIASNNGTVAAGAVVSYSIFIKRGNTTWVRAILADTGPTFTNGANVWFNVSTGTLGTVALRGTATGVTAVVQIISNGWYRLTGTLTLPAGITTAAIAVSTANADNSVTRVNNGAYYIWGAQAETGAFATSYIPTTAAAVVRAFDSLTMPTGAWFSTTAGSVMNSVISRDFLTIGYNAGLFSLDDGASNRANCIDQFAFTVFSGGNNFAAPANNIRVAAASTGTLTNTGTPAITPGNPVNYAMAWTATALSATLNGLTSQSAAVTGLPPGVNRLTIGAGFGGVRPLDGWYRRLQYWPRALSNSELQQVTT